MRLAARIFGFFFAFLFIVFLAKFSFAQTDPTNTPAYQPPQYAAPNTNPDVPQNLHTYTQNVVIELMSTVVCMLSGIDPINQNQKCLGLDSNTGKFGYVDGGGGAIGLMTVMIAQTYTVPLHVGDYFVDMANGFGIAKPTYAQANGVGFQGLQPVLKLWKIFRDIAYLLFIAIFIVIGIAIMLRVRIDPRTVMTIQNQIPKLIIGIVMVTFSFAIAGFLIDLMWVSSYVVIGTVAQGSDKVNADQVSEKITQDAPKFAGYIYDPTSSAGLLKLAVEAANAISDLVQNMFIAQPNAPEAQKEPVDQLKPFTTGDAQALANQQNQNDAIHNAICVSLYFLCSIQTITDGVIGDAIGNIIGVIINWIVKIVAFLIIAIAVLWALIKLWISLIKAYVFVLIDTVLAPFWIIAGLLPGAGPGVGWGAWLRDLFANLAVFPVVIGLFMFARVILDNFGAAGLKTDFSPPLLGSTLGVHQDAGGNPTTNIGPLIVLGIILMMPSVADSVKKAIKASGPRGGLGGLGTGVAVVSAPFNSIRHQFFGRNPRTGEALAGSAYIGRKFGRLGPGVARLAQFATGGGTRLPRATRTATRNVPIPGWPGTTQGQGGNQGGGGNTTPPPAGGPTAPTAPTPPPANPGPGTTASGITIVRRRTRP